MSDTQKKYHKLSEVLARVKAIIYEKTQGIDFWVTAEISNISFHKSGHCYLDLTENVNNSIKAQCKATIWSKTLFEIENELGSDSKNVLKKGNEILFRAEIIFSEVYGFQLNIKEVDLTFAIGVLEKKKQEVIKQLTTEGLLNINKQKTIPKVIQKIALIGSPNTSGFTDFREQLLKNQYGYNFSITTFSCSVQGEKAEAEIVSCFNSIRNQKFDIVALIRGGGSKLDLEVFNSYSIASSIAKFPLPVWTGIGHETDTSVCDLVVNLQHKTPSALASHIVEIARNVEVEILTYFNHIRKHAEYQLEKKKRAVDLGIQYLITEPLTKVRRKRGDLHNTSTRIINTSNLILKDQILYISDLKTDIVNQVSILMDRRKNSLKSFAQILQVRVEKSIATTEELISNKLDKILTLAKHNLNAKIEKVKNITELIEAFDPINILAKGYSIVRFKETLLKDQTFSKGDELEIETSNRKIIVSYINEKEAWTKSLMKKLRGN